MDARVTLLGIVGVMATCLTLVNVEGLGAQEPSGAATTRIGDGGQSPASVTLEGFVLLPDGSPLEGAVVVSSAGGKALTDVAGSYRLKVEVPLGATSVQVTATGRTGDDLAASMTVAVSAAPLPTRVNLVVLPRQLACSPSWVPRFGAQPGTDAGIGALAVYDDGSGPELYAGGVFSTADGVPASGIARWNGSRWSALGSGVSGTSAGVRALATYDDGSGPALYVAGFFTTAGGLPANNIAKWDGSSWSTLGSGLSNGLVEALAVFDDGGGPELYAGGIFQTAGGVPARDLAKWNGSRWSALSVELGGGRVNALAGFDDGGGPALYAGGQFWSAGGVPSPVIAKWDGTSWAALGSGLIVGDEDEDTVFALAVHDDGSGPALFVGGATFVTPGGDSRIAKWDGTSWAGAGGNALGGTVQALTVFNDGGGPELYAGGSFRSGIARWDGLLWSTLGSGLSTSGAGALAVYDDGGGPALFAGGAFESAGGVLAKHMAKWDGSSWTAPGSGIDDGMNGFVEALAVHDDGNGPALYAGGDFTRAGGVEASRIARWNGSSWAALGSGMNNDVRALAAHDDGSGPALFAGGLFTSAGGVRVRRIAKWDGSSWAPLGGGFDSGVLALVVHDDGGGPALFAGGTFATSTGGPKRIARWDGSSWTPLGGGMNNPVLALVVFDDGGGPALFAGGTFTTAGGVAANRIARWDGSSWAQVGPGVNGAVDSLVVHDDGSGPALYAGGSFTSAGGVTANRIARWDGSSWSALASGIGNAEVTPQVTALASFDDGGRPALYAGGNFTSAGGVAANRIARWNGSSWSALGGGVAGSTLSPPAVLALVVHDDVVHDDDDRPALFAGGSFSIALDSGDSFLAKWGCPDEMAPVLVCPSSIAVLDRFTDGPGEVVSFTVTAHDDLDPSPVVACVPPSGSAFPPGTTLVDCTATDASGNQSTCQFPVTVTPKARPR